MSVIAVSELMLATKEVIATTFQPFPLYLAAAAIYWGDERVVRDTAKKAGDAPEPELFALRTVIDTPDCRGM